MRRSVSAATAAALLLAAPTSLTGCQHADQDTSAPSVTPPEDVLRAYAWDCDGGVTLRMKNVYRENAITLDLQEGPRKLPQVVSASGAKYSDGSLTFWTKGRTATLERPGSATIQCNEVRAQSLLADARERGVLYRGIGNEPGWTVEIGPGQRLVYVTHYGQERREFEVATAGADDAGQVVYVAEIGSDSLKVTITREDCADDMSGEAFDHRVVVEQGGREYRGCGTALQ